MGEKRIEGFLSLEEASMFLGGMPTKTIKNKVQMREIPAYKPGKSLLFDPKELREYIKRHKK